MSSVWRLVVGFALLAVASTLVLTVAVLLLPWRVGRIKLCNLYGKIIGWSITRLAGVRPRVRHRERLDAAMPAIYVANHTSSLDAFLCIWLCPFGGCGVFKKEIVRVPFFGWLAALSGHLLLDRSHTGRAVEALRKTAELVRRHGLGVWIMPEGTRSRDGRLLPFKKGFVHLAIATGLPVVPVVIHGAHRNWAKGTLRFRSIALEVEVLPSVTTSEWREETAGDHAAAVRALFREALEAEQDQAQARAA